MTRRRCRYHKWSIEYSFTHIIIYVIKKYNVIEGVLRVWSLSNRRVRVYRFLLVAALASGADVYFHFLLYR